MLPASKLSTRPRPPVSQNIDPPVEMNFVLSLRFTLSIQQSMQALESAPTEQSLIPRDVHG